MDIVLGVSMTPTAVRMVLVESEQADGRTIEHDVFDVPAITGGAIANASDQVVAAILGTRESALAGGHRLVATGVTWSEHAEAAVLRRALCARGVEDVALASELHAAGALAEAVGRAVGYETTALMFIERATATLAVVKTADGAIVKVVSRKLHSADALAVLAEMVTGLHAHKSRPQGIFIVGAGMDVTPVKAHMEDVVPLPVIAPAEPELALARGAALAAARAPRSDGSTVGLAYSQDPDGATDVAAPPVLIDDARHDRNALLLVGSSLTALFVAGMLALVISLAVSIRPTASQRPSTGANTVVPSAAAPAPHSAAPETQSPLALPRPDAQTIEVAPPPAAVSPPPPPAATPPLTQRPSFICRHLGPICRLAHR